MLVSKTWAENSVELLWHRPLCNSWKNLLNVVHSIRKQKSYFKYAELVKRLNLTTLATEVGDGTIMPLAGCNRIERLTLANCKSLSDTGVLPLIEDNQSLLALEFTGLELITNITLNTVATNCPRLQGLNVSGCTQLTDDSLSCIARNCRSLKRIKLNDCSQLTDLSIRAFAYNCRQVLEIDLQNCSLTSDSSVTSLVAHASCLRELRLAHCSLTTDDAWLSVSSDRVLETLRILDLTACELLTDVAVAKIVAVAPRLRNLVLAKCKRITDRAVVSIAKLGKNLHYVHLGHCSQITDSGVTDLVKACNRIRYIDLACCQRLTDASVTHLAMLPKLRRIGLVKCHTITDASIYALGLGRLSTQGVPFETRSLERVHLSYCVNLTLGGIHDLLKHCPRLTHLSVTGVQAFLRDDITAFCREAPSEFTEHQREVFCVFSGAGVRDLREHLDRVALSNAAAEGEAARANDEEFVYDEDEGGVHPGALNGQEHASASLNAGGDFVHPYTQAMTNAHADDDHQQVTGMLHATGLNEAPGDDDDDEMDSEYATPVPSTGGPGGDTDSNVSPLD